MPTNLEQMIIKKKRICVVSGSRAEYGLLKKLISLIDTDPNLDLSLLVTGSHLEEKYGLTINEIISDGIRIDGTAKIHSSRKEPLVTTISRAIKVISVELKKIYPDFVIILGDRYEIFAAATASFFLNIPIIHIHGGEKTLGSIDEVIRHSVTKMSYFHFVATEEYRSRVIQLGEDPDRVINVGGLGVDYLKDIDLYTKEALEKDLRIEFNKKNILVTIHPETTNTKEPHSIAKNILTSLNNFSDLNIFFTEPNADPGSRKIIKLLKEFVKNRKGSFLFPSLGIKKYLSLVKQMDVVVGNSSSGLLEVPSLKIPTLNIGNRQQGRLQAKSVFNCTNDISEINSALGSMIDNKFYSKINFDNNPYGNGGASVNILKEIKKLQVPSTLEKEFFDL